MKLTALFLQMYLSILEVVSYVVVIDVKNCIVIIICVFAKVAGLISAVAIYCIVF